MNLRRSCWLLLVAALFAACGSSPPLRYVTLEPLPPERRQVELGGGPLAVGRVTLPPELERDQLVVRLGEGRVDLLPDVRWIAPLELLVRRALALDLAARLAEGRVVLEGQPRAEEGLRHLVVSFATFSAGPPGRVTLDARWSIARSESQAPELAGESSFTLPAGDGTGADYAQALGLALGRLADEVALALEEREQAAAEP